jgi:uncharacterized protein
MPFAVEVRPGRFGLGVFATQPFATGETVEVCPCLEIPEEQVVGVLEAYVFASAWTEGYNTLLFGYGSLYNHSADPNVEVVQEGEDAIAMIALRDIEAGEELFHHYGDDYWDTRDIDPG